MFFSIALVLLIYFAPKSYPAKKVEQKAKKEVQNSIETQVEEVKAALQPDKLTIINNFQLELAEANTQSEKTRFLDSIIQFWDNAFNPPIAAIYARKKADLTHLQAHRMEAGERFLNMAVMLDPKERPWAYQQAKQMFEIVLKTDPRNAEAKIYLGTAIVKGGLDMPMKGIAFIKEVLKENPKNIKALMQLGHFSILSQQFSKAIERFNQVLRIDSTVTEALFFLGDTYAKKGEKEKAIYYLQAYKKLQKNVMMKKQIEHYINRVKKNLSTNKIN